MRKKKEESKDIYKEILRVKEEEKKAEDEAIKKGIILPVKKINKGGFFATEVRYWYISNDYLIIFVLRVIRVRINQVDY